MGEREVVKAIGGGDCKVKRVCVSNLLPDYLSYHSEVYMENNFSNSTIL